MTTSEITGLMLGTSALETLYGAQFTLPTHFMIPNNLDIPKSRERILRYPLLSLMTVLQ